MVASTPAQAKVTGFHDSAAQIKVILSSPVVARALGQQAIVSLDALGLREDAARIWRVGTETCDIRVVLIAITPRQSGKPTAGIDYRVEEPVKTCG